MNFISFKNCTPYAEIYSSDKVNLLKTVSISYYLQCFSVNGAEYVVGQENIYEDPCDEWLDLINKQLTSPNYPDPYEPLTHCIWNLTEKQGFYVSLDFEKIDVSYDELSIVS